jgi:hypothetical protein
MHAKHEHCNHSTLNTTHFLTATSKTYTQVFGLRRQLPRPTRKSCDVCGQEDRSALPCGGCGNTLCYKHSFHREGIHVVQFCLVCNIDKLVDSEEKMIDSILADAKAKVKARRKQNGW